MNSLPDAIKDEILNMPEYSYGVNKVTVELDNGQIFEDVFIGWGEEIIKIGDSKNIPFDPAKVVKVVNTV
ncbi:MAG: hypothetical protein H6968_09010 [Chromatiaceae bacterium]|nr:hypothetical protein [Chromatiaceae bacterium]